VCVCVFVGVCLWVCVCGCVGVKGGAGWSPRHLVKNHFDDGHLAKNIFVNQMTWVTALPTKLCVSKMPFGKMVFD
jgi:hypothetical protein